TNNSIRVNAFGYLRRIPDPPVKIKRWNESTITTNGPHQAGRIGLSSFLRGIDVGDIEVKLVHAARLDLDLMLGISVPIFRNQVQRHDVPEPARTSRLVVISRQPDLRVSRSLAIPSGEPDQVFARLQPVLSGYFILPLHNPCSALGVLSV